MTGSKFIEGILSCGVEVELSKAIMAANTSYANQMKEAGLFQLGESQAGYNQSVATQNAEDALAQVEMDNANTQLFQGITQIASPAATGIGRSCREAGMIGRENGFFGQSAGKSLSEINEEGQNVASWKKVLQGDPADVVSGNKSTNPLAANDITDEQVQNLKNDKFANSKADSADPRYAVMKTLKNFRGQTTKDTSGNTVQSPRGKAYEDMESALDNEEKSINNHQQRYDATTERWTTYMQAVSQSTTSFAGYGGGKIAADDRKVQAQLDANRTLRDYAVQNQKSAADQAIQGSQNSAQSMAELARAKSEIAQANRM